MLNCLPSSRGNILLGKRFTNKIFLCEEYIKDWRISMTRRRVIQVTAELLVCSIHPIPGISLFTSKPPNVKLPPSLPARMCVTHQLDDSFSPYLLFILPMIGRMYLAFRALLLHSKMFNDAGSRSIGAMNKPELMLRTGLRSKFLYCAFAGK
ncbi:uncharacterized protein DEA37_0000964 [Paragonimus westermani]|uniref:Uncharacterized protein n=1 Tax=Paragonimus westermani TaxID=34504 RepID=A0A5J4NVS2_9TREM|nr:uncharacterized protein DEA37_0000964 [Paragonimus westermani]